MKRHLFLLFFLCFFPLFCFGNDVYITNPVKQFNISPIQETAKKQIPLSLSFWNDPSTKIQCQDLNEEDFVAADKTINADFYKGVLWIQAEFPETEVDDNLRLNFGLKQFILAEAYAYNSKTGDWALIGRTGSNLPNKYVQTPSTIPSITMDKSTFPAENVHKIRVKMINYDGSKVTMQLTPEREFLQNEKRFSTLNSFFIGLFLALIMIIIFTGYFTNQKLYIFIGAAFATLFLVMIFLRRIGSSIVFTEKWGKEKLFFPAYLLNILNSIATTLIFTLIINESTKEKKFLLYVFANFVICGICSALLFTGASPKILYILINAATIVSSANILMLWISNRKLERKTQYVLMDAWILTLGVDTLIRILDFISTFSSLSIPFVEQDIFVPQNLLCIVATVVALLVTPKQYNSHVKELSDNLDKSSEENSEVFARLNLRRAIDRRILATENTILHAIKLLDTKIDDHQLTSTISFGLRQDINMLQAESILENSNIAKTDPFYLQDIFERSLNFANITADRRNITIKSKTENIEKKIIIINKGICEYIITNMISIPINLCTEGSKLSVNISLSDGTLRMETKTTTDQTMHSYASNFEEQEEYANALGFTLIKKILPFYQGTFSVEDLGTGFKYSLTMNVEEAPSLDNISSETEKVILSKKQKPEFIDKIFSINDRIPYILYASDDATSKMLLENTLGKHCHLYTTNSGDLTWSFLKKSLSDGTRLPDLIISDYSLPTVSGMELFRKCTSEDILSDIPFVFILQPTESTLSDNLLAMGAVDCIAIPFSATSIYKSVYSIYSMSHKIRHAVISQVTRNLMEDTKLPIPQKLVEENTNNSTLALTNAQTTIFTREGLSTREQQIALLILNGHTDKEIAEKLNISVGTVTTHNKKIFKKLGVHSRIELVNKVR